MIMETTEIRRFIDTQEEDQALEARLRALEASIKRYTNNDFRRVLEDNGGEWPDDIKMGVVDLLRWKLRNEAANSGDTSKKDVQSETLSRHSVTYATDTTEADIDERLGYPRKYAAFLRSYIRARFGKGTIGG